MGPIIGAVLGGVATWLLSTYQFDHTKNWDQAQSIIKLEDDESATNRDLARVQGELASTEANVNIILGQVGSMKTSFEIQTQAFHDLQKKFDDIDSVLRPLRPNGPAH